MMHSSSKTYGAGILKILGIDPGTLVTGYGIVERGGKNGLSYLCDGEITVNPSMSLSERLLAISKGIDELIERFKPDALAVESLFFSKNVKSAIMLGHARGVVLLSAASSGLEVFEYPPLKIKQAIVGYGGASKEQVQRMVKVLLNIKDLSSPDSADALAVAICHIHHSSGIPI